MFEQDIIVRQIQQLLAALLKRAAETLQIPTLEELQTIFEELSGLSGSELETLSIPTLVYLLKLRCGKELRSQLVEALRLKALIVSQNSSAGDPNRWRELADALEVDD